MPRNKVAGKRPAQNKSPSRFGHIEDEFTFGSKAKQSTVDDSGLMNSEYNTDVLIPNSKTRAG